MRPSPRKPLDELDELRRLLVRPAQEDLRRLRDRLDDKEQRAHEVASVLPEAVSLSADRSEELSRALQPVIEEAVRESIKKEPEVFIEALHPIVGPAVWRSILKGLRAQYQPRKFSQSYRWVRFAMTVFAALIAAALVVGARSEMRWQDFIWRMNSAPGIAVTQAKMNWFQPSQIAGLRDPAGADPAALARAAGIDPTKIRFEWKDYLALDDFSVLQRFEQRFGKPSGTTFSLTNGILTIGGKVPFEWLTRVENEGRQLPGISAIRKGELALTYDPELAMTRLREAYPLPAGTTARIHDGTLFLAGTAPYEWLASVREGATKIPGISRISEDKLQVAFDSDLVLQRFTDRFNLPDSVNAKVESGVLQLSGEAPHAWLTRVRRGAPSVPGIERIDERNLLDLDQQEYEQSKSVIESALLDFMPNEAEFAAEGFAILSRLPDSIRRCLTATKRLGLEVQFEVRGYADSAGDEQENFELSQRRADALRDFLVGQGFESSLFKTLGMGASPVGDTPNQSKRQVLLNVVPRL